MLGLVAAQLKHKVESKMLQPGKAVWVDVRHGFTAIPLDIMETGANCLDGWWHRVSIENGQALEASILTKIIAITSKPCLPSSPSTRFSRMST